MSLSAISLIGASGNAIAGLFSNEVFAELSVSVPEKAEAKAFMPFVPVISLTADNTDEIYSALFRASRIWSPPILSSTGFTSERIFCAPDFPPYSKSAKIMRSCIK